MATVAATVALAFFIVFLIKAFFGYLKQLKFSKEFAAPGLPFPIVGHSYLLYDVNREDILDTLLCLIKNNERRIGTIIGNKPIIWYFHPEPTEEILSSNEHISKSEEYFYLIVMIFDLSFDQANQ